MENLSNMQNMSATTVRTDKGTEIEADLVFKTIGLPVNSSAYKKSLGKGSFTLSNCESDIGNNQILLIFVELFASSDVKDQTKISVHFRNRSVGMGLEARILT